MDLYSCSKTMKIAMFHSLPRGGALRVFEEQYSYLHKKYSVKKFSIDIATSSNRLISDYLNFVELRNKHKKLALKVNDTFDVALIHPDKYTQAPFILRYLNIPTLYYAEEWLRIAYEKQFAFTDRSHYLKYIYEIATRQYRKKVDRDNARAATMLVGNSRFTANNIMQAYDKDAEYIHPGVDLRVFRKYRVKKKNQLIYVGATDKPNGYAFAKKIAKKAQLELKIIHGNKLTDVELAKEYCRSIATLCVSRYEPFGLVSIESQACKTPVLAIREGGFIETIKNNKSGYLLPREVDAFVRKIDLIKKGKQFDYSHINNFSWNEHNRKLEKMVLSLAND